MIDPVTANATADSGPSASKKFQSVLSIDFNDWQAACEAFKIEESLIKNRVVPPGEGDAGAGAKESEGEESGEDGEERDGGRGRVGRSAWYG